jgi:glutamate-ammonia-ligase adenylyltransferase
VSLDDLARHFAPDGPAAVWERQALVKARVVVGGQAAAARALRIVQAAAYERDWTAAEIEEIRRMRRRMEEGARATNLKRGPGGVVDIEFVVQAWQLAHGGGRPELRTPETLAGLERLHAAGLLPAAQLEFFAAAYRRFREIEGRLRLLDAPARHDFPASEPEQRALAHLLGAAGPEALVEEVRDLTARTRREFDAAFDQLVVELDRI